MSERTCERCALTQSMGFRAYDGEIVPHAHLLCVQWGCITDPDGSCYRWVDRDDIYVNAGIDWELSGL